MRNFAERMERCLIRLVVSGLVIMVVVQAVMTQDQYRMFLSWGERLEGEALQYPVSAENRNNMDTLEAVSPKAIIEISVEKYSSLPRAVIMVNGQPKGTFANRKVQLNLKAGDVVELDTRHYNFPIEFKISNRSGNVAYPHTGQSWTAHQGLVMLGKIIVK